MLCSVCFYLLSTFLLFAFILRSKTFSNFYFHFALFFITLFFPHVVRLSAFLSRLESDL